MTERRLKAWQLRKGGATFVMVGAELGVSRERARQMAAAGERFERQAKLRELKGARREAKFAMLDSELLAHELHRELGGRA